MVKQHLKDNTKEHSIVEAKSLLLKVLQAFSKEILATFGDPLEVLWFSFFMMKCKSYSTPRDIDFERIVDYELFLKVINPMSVHYTYTALI